MELFFIFFNLEMGAGVPHGGNPLIYAEIT